MNLILAYAIEHQAEARRLLAGVYRIPPGDVEELNQEVLVAIWEANPPHDKNPRAYWGITIKTRCYNYFSVTSRKATSPLPLDRSDRRQEVEPIALARETLREAWVAATPAERRAMIARLGQQRGQYSNSTKVNICRLKRKLRERAAA